MSDLDPLDQRHLRHEGRRLGPPLRHDTSSREQHSGQGHRWLMIACCIPMVVVVAVLLATGAAGSGALVFAAICLGMMALMMFAMPGGHDR